MDADARSAEAPPFLTVLLLFGLLAFSGELVSAAEDLWTEVGALRTAWQWIFGLGLDLLLIAALWWKRARPATTELEVVGPPLRSWLAAAVLFLGLDVAREFQTTSPTRWARSPHSCSTCRCSLRCMRIPEASGSFVR